MTCHKPCGPPSFTTSEPSPTDQRRRQARWFELSRHRVICNCILVVQECSPDGVSWLISAVSRIPAACVWTSFGREESPRPSDPLPVGHHRPLRQLAFDESVVCVSSIVPPLEHGLEIMHSEAEDRRRNQQTDHECGHCAPLAVCRATVEPPHRNCFYLLNENGRACVQRFECCPRVFRWTAMSPPYPTPGRSTLPGSRFTIWRRSLADSPRDAAAAIPGCPDQINDRLRDGGQEPRTPCLTTQPRGPKRA